MPDFMPPATFVFQVDFDVPGVTERALRFQEVDGLRGGEVEEVGAWGESRFKHRLPTRVRAGNVTLKRGVVQDAALIAWLQKALEEQEIQPADVRVSLVDAGGVPQVTSQLVQAWPARWSAYPLPGGEQGLVVELLELSFAYQTLTMAPGG